MKQLIHNGVMIPPKYEAKGLHISVKGKRLKLTPEQEEMAVAFAKKIGTEYVNDRMFVKNFFKDFSERLGFNETLKFEDVDFSEIVELLERERELKTSMSREEKRRQAEERRILKEARKQQYGFAIVDGQRVEIANYMAEPSCIFMGRGKHPMRGRWKQGPEQSDIILNLSPDAPRPPGCWKEIVWQPDSMWIAKWDDKLSGKEKYIWLADTSTMKQRRDKEKFDQARELEKSIGNVRRHIMANLKADDIRRRKVATVCYLIDALKLRVGDEKDKDEADTVGATTLRPNHIKIKENGCVTFNFLGKDSVRWRKEVQLPEPVIENIRTFIENAQSAIFNGVRSDIVSRFLGEAVPNLTAKVFRTYHATKAVREYLEKVRVSRSDPDYVKKYVATMANLQAAIICNHKRKLPKNWMEVLKKRIERLRKLRKSKRKTRKILESIEKAKVEVEKMKATRDYNLRTSLKSYIDPRVYKEWGMKVGFDWKLYYPKTLQRKFSWIEEES
ncbi:MAG: DNA topoisomerase I [Candidatus Bathyarchaeia archaeon]